MTDAIILAGGSGKRLGMDVPKALIKLGNETLIDKQIRWLKSYGIQKIIVAEGYKHEQVQNYLGNKVIHSVEKEPLGTAGAINLAQKHVSGDFIVINVDDLTHIKINELIAKGPNTLCLARMRSPYGVVHTKGDFITRFEEKPLLNNIWVSCGTYFLSKDILLPEKGSIENEIFPKMKLKYYKHFGKWNTFNNLKEVEEYLKFAEKIKLKRLNKIKNKISKKSTKL